MATNHHQNDDAILSSRSAPVSSIRIPAGLEEGASNHQTSLAGASAGVLAGAALGSFAGPVGMIAGGIAGAVAGVAASVALDTHEVIAADAEKKLDEEIGVIAVTEKP